MHVSEASWLAKLAEHVHYSLRGNKNKTDLETLCALIKFKVSTRLLRGVVQWLIHLYTSQENCLGNLIGERKQVSKYYV